MINQLSNSPGNEKYSVTTLEPYYSRHLGHIRIDLHWGSTLNMYCTYFQLPINRHPFAQWDDISFPPFETFHISYHPPKFPISPTYYSPAKTRLGSFVFLFFFFVYLFRLEKKFNPSQQVSAMLETTHATCYCFWYPKRKSVGCSQPSKLSIDLIRFLTCLPPMYPP